MSTVQVQDDAQVERNPAVRAVFDDIRATRKTSFVNNMWRALANQPTLLARTWHSVKEVMVTPGALDPLTKELIYIAASTVNNCGYCVHSHTAAARAKGMTDAQHGEMLAVIALAVQTNALATALQVPVDEAFLVDGGGVMTTMAMVAKAVGGPEVLEWREVPLAEPGPGEVVIRHRAIGVNFIDAYYRSGLYPWPSPAWIPGAEACGEIVGLGAGVVDRAVGDRVAYIASTGGYATERVMPSDRLVRVPEGIADDVAAASLLKGMTVQFLVTSTFAVRAGHSVLVHAAAGGVGLLLGQWLRHLGATSVGIVGTEAKVDAARRAGYDHVLVRTEGGFADRVRELTGGAGCDVVYDSVGADTWRDSLRSLKRLGVFVSFGQSSGPIQGFAISDLAKGSLTAIRPSLFDHIVTPEALVERATALFTRFADGTVRAGDVQRARLQDAAEVHRAMEGRRTTGATVLVP